jgi:phosphoenolpyruvate-protein phosphotransferase/dihydroxyacetone kinase phosphotransfer subunit
VTGLVVVSHSRALADAAVALAGEMLHGSEVRISVAAGLDATTFGTDATAIVEAIHAADDGVGVVVLMDLGSAVLSAEMALDMVDRGLQERVVLCPAPLVEGLVVAAVAAAGGAEPGEVASEAVGSLAAKQAHVAPPLEPSGPAVAGVSFDTGFVPGTSIQTSYTAVVKIANPHGLHARPAARLVQEARLFDARIELRNLDTGAGPVPASSLSRVATLGALCGHRVELTATGSQAREALDHVVSLADRRFDEQDVIGAPARELPIVQDPNGAAIPASPGIAIGPAISLRTADVTVPDETRGDTPAEWRRIRAAIAEVRREIQRIRVTAAREGGEGEARIFDAHLMLIDDEDLLDDVRARIGAGDAASRAWADAIASVEARFADIPDEYLRARVLDVHAVGQQVARALTGAPALQVEGEGVLIAEDLVPAQVAELHTSRVTGIVMAAGSPTSHSVILARSRAIPTVVAAGPAVLEIPAGTTVALDGTTGGVFVDPSAEMVAELRLADRHARAKTALAKTRAMAAAVTGDGVEVLVGANLGSTDDARAAAAQGADLAGLVRTEFLYLDRREPPTTEEQVEVYRSLADAMAGKRLTLRTLDIGGDKPLPYAPQPHEANPFLGMRGIRLALAQRDLLDDQLRAIVAVAHDTPVSVMFPMVCTVAELAEAQHRLENAIEFAGAGRPDGLQIGIMVEVPAAALKAAAFAPHVDFFSIGTNDLTQYTLAAERGNPSVASLGDPLDPGVLRLVEAVCRAAEGRCLVAVCGELAADETATQLLVALGVRELSVAPSAVPEVKQAVRQIDRAQNTDLVHRCLTAASSGDVRAILG